MKNIEMKSGCVYYYGNPAGYIDKDTAVLDNMFRNADLESWIAKRNLTLQWEDGVYDRLVKGGTIQKGETVAPLKSCRIWQLKPDVDVMMKFTSYKEMTERFGELDPNKYNLVYDGQIGSNDLEAIWIKFNTQHPPGYTGHSLSISDVIELYNHNGSEYYYVDRIGFKQIDFDSQEPEQTQGMNMNI